MEDLSLAVAKGCDFCSLLMECLKGYADMAHPVLLHGHLPTASEWKGSSCNVSGTLYSAAKRSTSSGVRITCQLPDQDRKQVIEHLWVHHGVTHGANVTCLLSIYKRYPLSN